MSQSIRYSIKKICYLFWMTKMRSLAEILSSNDDSEELYTTDNVRRKKRAQMGRFTKSSATLDFIHLVKNWDKIVGPMLAQNTIPLRVKSGNLFILTKHAVFSQELSLMSQLIIDKVEELFPSFRGHIKKVRFSTGDYSSEEFNNMKDKNNSNPPPNPKHHPFDPKYRMKKKQADALFSDIDDEEIKQLLVQVYLAD
jgi:hypothetical protein